MVLLTELAGTIFSGYMTYIIKLIMYVIVAAIGISLGIHMRKKKNKESESVSNDK